MDGGGGGVGDGVGRGSVGGVWWGVGAGAAGELEVDPDGRRDGEVVVPGAGRERRVDAAGDGGGAVGNGDERLLGRVRGVGRAERKSRRRVGDERGDHRGRIHVPGVRERRRRLLGGPGGRGGALVDRAVPVAGGEDAFGGG